MLYAWVMLAQHAHSRNRQNPLVGNPENPETAADKDKATGSLRWAYAVAMCAALDLGSLARISGKTPRIRDRNSASGQV